jgi:hypothetical protein
MYLSSFLNKIFKSEKINIEIIEQAILDYRADGITLMEKLGKKYSLDIYNEDDYSQLISKNNKLIPRKGELSKRWNYCFHGGECGFYNKKYQQSVEVVLTNPPKFGYIDAWFLMKYMKSTEKYKHNIKDIEWTELKPLLDKLYKSGRIENIE